MAKRKRAGSGGVPKAAVVAGLHVISDLVLRATCPRCGGQVVLYYCKSCKRQVWPKRQNPFGR